MDTEKWVKQYASKRWHLVRGSSDLAVCGMRVLPTKKSDTPEWHVACRSCLYIMNKRKRK